jgi:ribonuclease P protein component
VPLRGTDSRLGFPRDRRLTDAKQFAQVFAARRRFACGNVQVYVCQNGARTPRLGLAISRKATGTAVLRNRLKRQAREAFRRIDPPLFGLDIIVNVSRPLSPEAQRRFSTDLRTLLERARTCAPR